MTEKKKQTEAGATELKEDDLEKAQGGWSWGETNDSVERKKKATKGFIGLEQDG